jgi:hypothetical protein
MSNYDNLNLARCVWLVRFCNPSKSKTMTFNLIARKNLFRLATFFKRRADYASRRNQNGLAKIYLHIWAKLLDTRDALR